MTAHDLSARIYAKSIPESADAATLQQRAAQYAKFAREWVELAGCEQHLIYAREYQEQADRWYALARAAA